MYYKHDLNYQYPSRSDRDSGVQLTMYGACCLGSKEVNITHSEDGKNSHGEEDDSQSACPV